MHFGDLPVFPEVIHGDVLIIAVEVLVAIIPVLVL